MQSRTDYACGYIQAARARWNTPDAVANVETAVGENDHKARLNRGMFVAEVL